MVKSSIHHFYITLHITYYIHITLHTLYVTCIVYSTLCIALFVQAEQTNVKLNAWKINNSWSTFLFCFSFPSNQVILEHSFMKQKELCESHSEKKLYAVYMNDIFSTHNCFLPTQKKIVQLVLLQKLNLLRKDMWARYIELNREEKIFFPHLSNLFSIMERQSVHRLMK